jgi:cytochrome c556
MLPLKQLVLLSIFFILAGCNTIQNNSNNENKQALCKEMKYQMIFSGKNRNPHTAMQQRAGMDNLKKSYREAGC